MRSLLALLALLVVVGCANPVPPPGPAPLPPPGPSVPGSFTVQGKAIVIEAKMKPNAPLPMGQVESTLKVAVRMLEAKKS